MYKGIYALLLLCKALHKVCSGKQGKEKGIWVPSLNKNNMVLGSTCGRVLYRLNICGQHMHI